MEIKSKFRQWLYENGLTTKDFCRQIKAARSSLSRWETGACSPGPRRMYQIRMVTKGRFATPEDLMNR
jgi:transcriptional regulator with XRE-family HTH domain